MGVEPTLVYLDMYTDVYLVFLVDIGSMKS